MRVLHSWLQRYIPIRLSPEDLAERLGMLGLETESVERLGDTYRGFVVGNVLAREPHPQADRLTVCTVDIGGETVKLVCGAPNVAPGQKVVVGLPGATVPRNQHDPSGAPFTLTKATIRGVESSGMICSEYELELGTDADGILVLDPAAPVGQPLATFLGLDDIAYEMEITPNRPDWMSHIGIAREIRVITRARLALPDVAVKESSEQLRKHLSVEVVDREHCLRFAARMVTGVRVGPSPEWMQRLLRNVGLRPINNVVDVTNFVMLECGHPLHAFDYSLLRGSRIVVRPASAGAQFTTLDGKRHTLPAGTTMVCDAEQEVSIAGVMGGANSEIRETTTDVVLESAYWDPPGIRRTSKRLGISTDASQRFERGADPNIVRYALDRAAHLINDLAGGEVLRGVIDIYPRKIRPRIVALRPARANTLLGTKIPQARIIGYLERLGLERAGRSGERVKFRIPTFRVDLEREVDLIEEVARVHGYDNIDLEGSARIELANPFPKSAITDRIRDVLIGDGFQEVITPSMQDPARASLPGLVPVRLLNPLNQELSVLRTSLVPGLLDAVARNQNFGNESLRLFELGHVFCVDVSDRKKLVKNYLEEEKLGILMAGPESPRSWSGPGRPADIFDLKGRIESFLGVFALDKSRFISYPTSNGLTRMTLAIEINGSYAGYFGEVQTEALKKSGIEGNVFVGEILVDALNVPSQPHFESLPKFPVVRRDVALVVDRSVSAGELERVLRSAPTRLLQSVELFDVYEGKGIESGKKSLAFTLELLSREKTLTDAEIESAVALIVGRAEKELGAVLRRLETHSVKPS